MSLRCSGVCKSMHTPHAELKTLTEQQMQWQQQGRGRWIWVPLTPERSKEESWQQVECEGVHVCKMSLNGMPSTWLSVSGHSPPRQAWIKNILGLFWRLGQFALSKSRKASCNWERKERKFLHCSLLSAKPSLTLLPCILLITSPALVSSPLPANSVGDKHIPSPPSPRAHTCLGSCTLPSIYTERYFLLLAIFHFPDLSQTAPCPFLPTSPYFFSILKVNLQSCIFFYFF